VLKYKTHSSILYKLRPVFVVFLLFVGALSCNDSKRIEEEISKLPLHLEILRFDKEFDQVTPNNLGLLKEKYPLLFPRQYPDSIWLAKLEDSLQQVLRTAVREEFSNFDEEEVALTSLYKHVAYYFKGYKIPTVLTVTNDVDYQNRIIATDSILLVGLDNYLGADHEFYGSFSKFVAFGLDRMGASQ